MTWLRSIDKGNIHPGLVEVMGRALRRLDELGSPFKIYSGLRTFQEQDQLYAKGRSTPGKIITKARGGQSMHNYGLAVDLAPLNLATTQDWDVHWPDLDGVEGHLWFSLEEQLEDAARWIDEEKDDGLDYEWGGRWRFRDVPHCQVRVTLRELRLGYYPHCNDVEWLVRAHLSFLYDTKWRKRRVQYLLNALGYNAGQVDGIYGDQTFSASRAFEIIVRTKTERELVEALVRAYQVNAVSAS